MGYRLKLSMDGWPENRGGHSKLVNPDMDHPIPPPCLCDAYGSVLGVFVNLGRNPAYRRGVHNIFECNRFHLHAICHLETKIRIASRCISWRR